MAGTDPDFLQVPKALPHRKARSRSKSRSRSPTPAADPFVPSSPKLRPHSPPVPPAQHLRKPALNGSATPPIIPPRHTTPSSILVPSLQQISSKMTDELETTNYDDLNGGMYTLEPCLTPPLPEPSLRQKLIGAWKLESYTTFPTPTSTVPRPTYPMTKNVTGLILYTPDGYVSAQMLIPGQQSFKRGEGEEPQWAEAAKRSFSYSGPYYITNEGIGREEILRHTFQVCNLPGWIGDIQIRTCRFEEDGQVLVLGSEVPTEIKGDKRIPVLKWRRARDNTDGTPPPPMPQIKISGPGEP